MWSLYGTVHPYPTYAQGGADAVGEHMQVAVLTPGLGTRSPSCRTIAVPCAPAATTGMIGTSQARGEAHVAGAAVEADAVTLGERARVVRVAAGVGQHLRAGREQPGGRPGIGTL